MHQSSSSATGKLIGTYGYGKALQIFMGIFAIVLLGMAGFVGYLKTITAFPGEPAPAGATGNFNGPPELFYYVMAFLVALALCMVLTIKWQQKLRNACYEVYEKGIRQVTSGQDEFVAFTEMDDLYLFASGQTITAGLINNLAYRRNASEPFRRVNAHLHRLEEFIDLVRERYLEERLPSAAQTLSSGGVVRFNYADTKQVWGKRITGNFLDVVTKPLNVTLQYLEVDGKRYPISLLREANTSAWTEKVVIKDNDGQVVLSTIATGIMSMDLFFNVLGLLQDNQQTHPAPKVAADY
ncbi:hypothetical protein [Pseudomonas sp.]|uniref:hypothetical protein n=1 Tax=Pseudomonas sp. TaxID=306 RepID=UPI0028AE9083|nr:hypothetical protein [Pseudomonas sp.]